MSFDLATILPKIGMIYIPLLLALCVHEWAHGFMAKMRGDNTAEMMGRLTLNPIAHMDPIGTVAFPLLALIFGSPIFFGWAKPVPFNIRNLKNPRVDTFWIALAGPLSNVVLALLTTLILAVLNQAMPGFLLGSSPVRELLIAFIYINLFLAIFNMIPLHPLDGGKVLARFLPARANIWLEQNEQLTSILLLVLMLMGAFVILAYPVRLMFNLLMMLASGGLF